jgi:hypothetical protein
MAITSFLLIEVAGRKLGPRLGARLFSNSDAIQMALRSLVCLSKEFARISDYGLSFFILSDEADLIKQQAFDSDIVPPSGGSTSVSRTRAPPYRYLDHA